MLVHILLAGVDEDSVLSHQVENARYSRREGCEPCGSDRARDSSGKKSKSTAEYSNLQLAPHPHLVD